MGLKYNDAVEFLHRTPQLLKTPLIVEGDKFFVGYNNEEIRQFIPSVQRQENYGDFMIYFIFFVQFIISQKGKRETRNEKLREFQQSDFGYTLKYFSGLMSNN